MRSLGDIYFASKIIGMQKLQTNAGIIGASLSSVHFVDCNHYAKTEL